MVLLEMSLHLLSQMRQCNLQLGYIYYSHTSILYYTISASEWASALFTSIVSLSYITDILILFTLHTLRSMQTSIRNQAELYYKNSVDLQTRDGISHWLKEARCYILNVVQAI